MEYIKNHKKQTIIIAAFVVVIILGAILFINLGGFGSGGNNAHAKDIVRTDTYNQTSDGVDYTNYDVIIKDDVDWASDVNDEKKAALRADIARYAIKTAQKQAEDEGIKNLNILGHTENGQTAFIYDGVDTINIIVDDAVIDRVKLEDVK